MAASASKGSAANSAAQAGKTVQIEIEELMRTREQLVQGLSNVSNAINEFVRSYVQHTNKWVGAESTLPTGVELAGMANLFGANTASSSAPLAAAVSAAVEAAVDKRSKKEKKPRKQKDPNAPKRPLTAYFLYTAHARPVVKNDFEENNQVPSAQDISNEILKRWNEMAEAEKDNWKKIYERNAEKYRAEVKEYLERTGNEASEKALAAPADADAVADDAAVPAAVEAPATKSKAKATKGKKKDASVAPAGPPADAASPSSQLNARSNVPLPTPSKAADGAGPKSAKRKSTAAAEDKAGDAAPKKKRKTKAEKEAEASAAAKEPAKETPAETAKAAPKPRKRKSTKADGA